MLQRFSLYPAISAALAVLCVPVVSFCVSDSYSWHIGPFQRADDVNPILAPTSDSLFRCPLQDKDIHWESDHIFNPAAVVRDGKVYLIYRAEDNFGDGIGMHTSRLGLAISEDGKHFRRNGTPVLFPNNDEQKDFEFPGGCEDPRVVENEDGTYVMTYTQWDRKVATLAIATSKDLLTWKKHGYAFKDDPNFQRKWSKSGSIVCRREGDKLVATKINGKYWMYWGEGTIQVASSEDLLTWHRVVDNKNEPIHPVKPREWKFDSTLAEPGPPAILTRDGIVLLYNGKNDTEFGDQSVPPRAYSAGQILFDANDPTRVISRTDTPFLTPQRDYEKSGQYSGGTVFIQGLVPFKGQWFLYYGTADSAIGVATSRMEFEKEL